MADSIRQQIIDAIDARLKTILIANGYKTNAGQHVYEWRATPLNESLLPAIVYRDIPNVRRDDGPIGYFRWALMIEIQAIAGSAGSTIADVKKITDDILKAINTDLRWSNLAQTTEQPESAEIEPEHEDKKYAGEKMIIPIIYDAPKWET